MDSCKHPNLQHKEVKDTTNQAKNGQWNSAPTRKFEAETDFTIWQNKNLNKTSNEKGLQKRWHSNRTNDQLYNGLRKQENKLSWTNTGQNWFINWKTKLFDKISQWTMWFCRFSILDSDITMVNCRSLFCFLTLHVNFNSLNDSITVTIAFTTVHLRRRNNADHKSAPNGSTGNKIIASINWFCKSLFILAPKQCLNIQKLTLLGWLVWQDLVHKYRFWKSKLMKAKVQK